MDTSSFDFKVGMYIGALLMWGAIILGKAAALIVARYRKRGVVQRSDTSSNG